MKRTISRMAYVVVPAVLLMGVMVQSAPATLITFGTGSLSNFAESYSTPDTRPSQYSESATLGLGGGAGLALKVPTWDAHDGDTLAYTPQTLDMTAGPHTLSVMYHYNWGNYPYDFPVQIGITGNTTTRFRSGDGPFASVYMRTWAAGGDWNYGVADVMYLKYLQTSGDGEAATAQFTLTSGHWYKLSATFNRGGTGNDYIQVSGVALEDWGTTGASFSSTVASHAASYQLSGTNTLVDDTSAYAALWGRTIGTGGALDNFYLPEPATMALLAIGGVGMLIRRRRRA